MDVWKLSNFKQAPKSAQNENLVLWGLPLMTGGLINKINQFNSSASSKKNKMKITIFFLKLHLSLFIISYCMICTKQKKFWSSLIDQIFCRRRRWWRNWVIFIQGVPYGWVIFDWCEYFLLLSRGVVGKERTLFKTLSKNKWSNINTL